MRDLAALLEARASTGPTQSGLAWRKAHLRLHQPVQLLRLAVAHSGANSQLRRSQGDYQEQQQPGEPSHVDRLRPQAGACGAWCAADFASAGLRANWPPVHEAK